MTTANFEHPSFRRLQVQLDRLRLARAKYYRSGAAADLVDLGKATTAYKALYERACDEGVFQRVT